MKRLQSLLSMFVLLTAVTLVISSLPLFASPQTGQLINLSKSPIPDSIHISTDLQNNISGAQDHCEAPVLVEPSDGAVVNDTSVTFRWNGISGCDFNGYTLRVCQSADISNLANCYVDTGVGGTSKTVVINGHDNEDLYWGVRAANASSASWSAARSFQIDPAGGATDKVVLYLDANYQHSLYSLGVGLHNDPNPPIKSMDMPDGWSVITYDQDNGNGGSKCWWNDEDNFEDYEDWSNRIRSVRIYSYYACPPIANFDAWPNYLSPGDAPLTVRFHNTSQGEFATCTWDYGDGSAGNVCDEYHNHIYYAPGTYSVYLTVHNNNGSDSNTLRDYITVTGPPDPPPRPTLINIINGDKDGSYSVSWTSVARADNYRLQEQKNGGSWTTIYDGPNTSLARSGQADGNWCYRVEAYNAGGSSGWSNIACTIVDTTIDPPPKSTINDINNGDKDGNFSVGWTSVAKADNYRLQEQKNGGSWTTIYDGPNTSLARSGQADGNWCYRVEAYNAGDSSGWSGVKCTTVESFEECFALSVAIEPVGSGSVDRSLQPNCNGSDYSAGSVVVLTANPQSGYRFSGWSGNLQGIGNPQTLTMNEDKNATATFTRHLPGSNEVFLPLTTYTISRFAGPNEREPNDTPHQANGAIDSGKVYRGAFSSEADLTDFYFFYMYEENKVHISLNQIPQGQDYDLYLFDRSIKELRHSKESKDKDESIVEALAPGHYYVLVHNPFGRQHPGGYALKATFE